MNRTLTLALVIAMGASTAYAKSCKDPTTGKFTKCPPSRLGHGVAKAGQAHGVHWDSRWTQLQEGQAVRQELHRHG